MVNENVAIDYIKSVKIRKIIKNKGKYFLGFNCKTTVGPVVVVKIRRTED